MVVVEGEIVLYREKREGTVQKGGNVRQNMSGWNTSRRKMSRSRDGRCRPGHIYIAPIGRFNPRRLGHRRQARLGPPCPGPA